MASYQRVALYIMYDAIENDIVDRIRNLARDEINLTQEEQDKAARRLSGREDLGLDLNQPYDLLYGLDLGEKFQVLLRHKNRMGEKAYTVKSFARSYISRLINPDKSLIDRIIRSYTSLDIEFTSERGHYNPYSMKNFKVSSRSRMVIAKKLKEAAMGFFGVLALATPSSTGRPLATTFGSTCCMVGKWPST